LEFICLRPFAQFPVAVPPPPQQTSPSFVFCRSQFPDMYWGFYVYIEYSTAASGSTSAVSYYNLSCLGQGFARGVVIAQQAVNEHHALHLYVQTPSYTGI
jgi:hypothetical protein